MCLYISVCVDMALSFLHIHSVTEHCVLSQHHHLTVTMWFCPSLGDIYREREREREGERGKRESSSIEEERDPGPTVS